jgi:hypothetical protein
MGKDKYFQLYLVTHKTTAIVLPSVETLLEKGHKVWLNNFYNSPALARLLKHTGIVCVGTLQCDVGLCVLDCFEAYHTKLNY